MISFFFTSQGKQKDTDPLPMKNMNIFKFRDKQLHFTIRLSLPAPHLLLSGSSGRREKMLEPGRKSFRGSVASCAIHFSISQERFFEAEIPWGAAAHAAPFHPALYVQTVLH